MEFFKRCIKNRLNVLNMSEDELMKKVGINSFDDLTVNELVKLADILEISRNILLESYIDRSMFTTSDKLLTYIDEDNLDAIKDLYNNNYLFNRSDELYLVKQLEVMKYPNILKKSLLSVDIYRKLAKYLLKKNEISMLINLSSVNYSLDYDEEIDKDSYFRYLISSFDTTIDIFKHKFAIALYEKLTPEDQLEFERRYIELNKRDAKAILEAKKQGKEVHHSFVFVSVKRDDDDTYQLYFKNEIHEKFSEAGKKKVLDIYKMVDDAFKEE